MFRLPLIFQFQEKPEEIPNFSALVTNSYWKEHNSHLVQFRSVKLPHDEADFIQILMDTKWSHSHAALFAGIAQYKMGSGMFAEAAKFHGYAFARAPKKNKKLRAFLILEMANLLISINDYDGAISLINSVKLIDDTEYLNRLASFTELMAQILNGEKDLTESVKESLKYFQKIKQYAGIATHYGLLGKSHLMAKQYDQAKDSFKSGINQARIAGYSHIEESISLELAELSLGEGKIDQCIQGLKNVNPLGKNYYNRVLQQAKLGTNLRQSGQSEQAVSHLQQGLNIATQYGVHYLIPIFTNQLGKSYEDQGKIELAHYFFDRGYQTAIELIRQYFTCSDHLLQAIESFTRFLKENALQEQNEIKEDDFSFAIDKSLIEIRSIFQRALLTILYTRYGTFKNMAEKLNISERTISLVKHRIKSYTFDEVPDSITHFIHENNGVSWKELNQKFEAKVLNYLYPKYDRNKRIMSEKMKISYPHMLNLIKTAEELED